MVQMLTVLIVVPDETVAIGHLFSRPLPFKEIGAIYPLHLQAAFGDGDLLGVGQEDPDQDSAIFLVPPQDLEGVMMSRLYDASQGRVESFVRLGHSGTFV
jgi:hypothetical protein